MALELWWLGQAGFRLRDPAGGAVVFCDPFLTVRDDRTWQAPIDPATFAQADLILVSHEHNDHLDLPSLKAAAQQPGSRFTLVVPRPVREEVARELGLPDERLIGAQPDEHIEVAGARVHPVPARHGVNVADAYNFGQELSNGLVRYLGYVVELGGARVYHSGDCSPYPGQAERLKQLRPDVALLPINGRDFFRESEHNVVGNMDHREAARLATDMGAQLLVPMHWELFETNRGFPGDLVTYASNVFPTLSILVMGRGARFTFVPTSTT
jgi:L-ascorbate metabolism protein UlaG (beta-lactamase superfamily)